MGQLSNLLKAWRLSCMEGQGPCVEEETTGLISPARSRMERKRTQPGASMPGFKSQLLNHQRDLGQLLNFYAFVQSQWDSNPLVGLLGGVSSNKTRERYLTHNEHAASGRWTHKSTVRIQNLGAGWASDASDFRKQTLYICTYTGMYNHTHYKSMITPHKAWDYTLKSNT